jgi:hypothetical protein
MLFSIKQFLLFLSFFINLHVVFHEYKHIFHTKEEYIALNISKLTICAKFYDNLFRMKIAFVHTKRL